MYYDKNKNTLTFCDLGGLSYVKNSDGKTSNVNFFVNGSINCTNDEVKLSYRVSAFKEGQKDYFDCEFYTFEAAQKAYNELAEKFNGYNDKPPRFL